MLTFSHTITHMCTSPWNLLFMSTDNDASPLLHQVLQKKTAAGSNEQTWIFRCTFTFLLLCFAYFLIYLGASQSSNITDWQAHMWKHTESNCVDIPVPLTTMRALVTRQAMSVCRAVWTLSVTAVTTPWSPPANAEHHHTHSQYT